MKHRVKWRYVDINLHMNQSSYLEVMELARWRWCAEKGVLDEWLRQGLKPFVIRTEIAYHRELRPGQVFRVETRLIERSGRTGLFEQAFLVDGHAHASAKFRYMFVQHGKTVPADQVGAILDPLLEEPLATDSSSSRRQQGNHRPAN